MRIIDKRHHARPLTEAERARDLMDRLAKTALQEYSLTEFNRHLRDREYRPGGRTMAKLSAEDRALLPAVQSDDHASERPHILRWYPRKGSEENKLCGVLTWRPVTVYKVGPFEK